MKRKIILTIFLIANLVCFSQNVLFLKNGDRLNGKLEGLKLDSLIFKSHGIKMNISSSDVISLFFDEKAAPSSFTSSNILTNNAKISGVVTYYFNSNYGDKPDVGAEVYILDSTKISEFMYEDVKDFLLATTYRDILVLSKKQKRPVPVFVQNKIEKFKLEDKTAFDEFDKNALHNIQKIMGSDNSTKTVADGDGNYSVKVSPGTYYILIVSNNRKGITITEVSGKVFCEKHQIIDGEELSINANFDL